MAKVILKSLSVACLLFVAGLLSAASAQEDSSASARKRTAVRELVESTETRRYVTTFFEEMVSRYQVGWPGSVVEGFKEKGLLKGRSPEQIAGVDKLVREVSDQIFGGIKRRVVGEVMTPEMLVSLVEPSIVRYLDEGEIEELLAFSRTPAARKFLENYSRQFRETVVSVLEAKGLFNVSSSPDEELAKIERIFKGSDGDTMNEVWRTLEARRPALLAQLTADELRELQAFAQTSAARKLAQHGPAMAAEIFANNLKLYAPRVGQVTGEVFEEGLAVFARRIGEVLKESPPAKRRRPTTGRR